MSQLERLAASARHLMISTTPGSSPTTRALADIISTLLDHLIAEEADEGPSNGTEWIADMSPILPADINKPAATRRGPPPGVPMFTYDDPTTQAIDRMRLERDTERQRVLELVRERDEAVRQREGYAVRNEELNKARETDTTAFAEIRRLLWFGAKGLPIVEGVRHTIEHFTRDRDDILRKANADVEELSRKLADAEASANASRAVLERAEGTASASRAALKIAETNARVAVDDMARKLDHATKRALLADAEWNAARVAINPLIAPEFDGQSLADAVTNTIKALQAKLHHATEAGQRAHDDANRIQKLLQGQVPQFVVHSADDALAHANTKIVKLQNQRAGHLGTIADQAKQIHELRETLGRRNNEHTAALHRQASQWEHDRKEGAEQVRRLIEDNTALRSGMQMMREQVAKLEAVGPREKRAERMFASVWKLLERPVDGQPYWTDHDADLDVAIARVLGHYREQIKRQGVEVQTLRGECEHRRHETDRLSGLLSSATILIEDLAKAHGLEVRNSREVIIERIHAKIVDAQATIGKQAESCRLFRERIVQLEEQAARREKLSAIITGQMGELRDRVQAIADEAFGPFPVLTAEESLTAIERGITHSRLARQRRELLVEAVKAWASTREDLHRGEYPAAGLTGNLLAAWDKFAEDDARGQTAAEAEQLEFLRSAGAVPDPNEPGDCQEGTCDCGVSDATAIVKLVADADEPAEVLEPSDVDDATAARAAGFGEGPQAIERLRAWRAVPL